MDLVEKFNKLLLGRYVQLNCGETGTIVEVGHVEPEDRSVGIFGTAAYVVLEDPQDGERANAVIFDDGKVHWCDEDGEVANPNGKGMGTFPSNFGETFPEEHGT